MILAVSKNAGGSLSSTSIVQRRALRSRLSCARSPRTALARRSACSRWAGERGGRGRGDCAGESSSKDAISRRYAITQVSGGCSIARHRWRAPWTRCSGSGAVRCARDHARMRTGAIAVGDIVYASKRGRLFHATVLKLEAGGALLVEPIQRNISYRHLDASDITAHWARATTTRRAPRKPAPQPTLELPLAL